MDETHKDERGKGNEKEKELLIQVSQGNESAFKVLIDLYSDRLGHFIAKITHNKEIAEEIVQDIFLKIWITRESLSTVHSFHSWLFTVSKNHAINALRKAVKERVLQENLQVFEFPQEDNAAWIKEHQLSLLDEAIALLPPQQQKVYLLSRRDGLKHKEIASQMALSQETVKKYIQYAIQSIMRHLEASINLSLFLFFIRK